jgi:glycosyltransferase involved in cell wall biosynthesis
MKYKFTVFTPAFKCEHTIHRVWESLKSQTFKDFEWIIVNDCSPDNTQEIIEKYPDQADFPVKIYNHPENLGKHFAWNLASDRAEGELFVPADADDSFVPETLETFLELWNKIPDNEKNEYSGINVLCKDPYTGEIVGNAYPNTPLVTNNLELSYKYNIWGEKWGVLNTKWLKKYQYPEFRTPRGNYAANHLFYLLALKGFKVICYNIPLRLYYTDDTQSVTQKLKKDPNRAASVIYTYHMWHLNNNIKFILKYKRYKKVTRYCINIIRNGLLLGKSIPEILKEAKNFQFKFYLSMLAVPSYLIFLRTYAKFKRA